MKISISTNQQHDDGQKQDPHYLNGRQARFRAIDFGEAGLGHPWSKQLELAKAKKSEAEGSQSDSEWYRVHAGALQVPEYEADHKLKDPSGHLLRGQYLPRKNSPHA